MAQDYFHAAWQRKDDPDLARFNEIARDDNWTGILILRADITKVPDDLAGIVAGVADPDGFHAHHVGVEITPVSLNQGSIPGPTVEGSSSVFGLIDYSDPGFTPPKSGEAAQPVQPVPGSTYDFRLLSLKVRFANTAVSSFRSYAQLTAVSWFDTPVVGMGEGGNPYHAIMLEGTLQVDDGQPIYSMSTDTDTISTRPRRAGELEITGAVSRPGIRAWRRTRPPRPC